MPQVKNAFYVHGNSVVEFKPDKTVRIDDYFLVNNQTKTKVIGAASGTAKYAIAVSHDWQATRWRSS